MTSTENIGLPLFDDDAAISLLDVYNPAMIKVDQMLADCSELVREAKAMAETATATANDAATNASEAKDKASAASDAVAGFADTGYLPGADDVSLNVQKLSDAKVTSSGIVYFKES